MIENQSDNIDSKKDDVSSLDNAPEDIASTQNSTLKMINYLLKKQKK